MDMIVQHKIANLITVVSIWGLVSYIFVFGFAQLSWTGWSGGLPWMAGVIGLFCAAALTSKYLLMGDKKSKETPSS